MTWRQHAPIAPAQIIAGLNNFLNSIRPKENQMSKVNDALDALRKYPKVFRSDIMTDYERAITEKVLHLDTAMRANEAVDEENTVREAKQLERRMAIFSEAEDRAKKAEEDNKALHARLATYEKELSDLRAAVSGICDITTTQTIFEHAKGAA